MALVLLDQLLLVAAGLGLSFVRSPSFVRLSSPALSTAAAAVEAAAAEVCTAAPAEVSWGEPSRMAPEMSVNTSPPQGSKPPTRQAVAAAPP